MHRTNFPLNPQFILPRERKKPVSPIFSFTFALNIIISGLFCGNGDELAQKYFLQRFIRSFKEG